MLRLHKSQRERGGFQRWDARGKRQEFFLGPWACQGLTMVIFQYQPLYLLT